MTSSIVVVEARRKKYKVSRSHVDFWRMRNCGWSMLVTHAVIQLKFKHFSPWVSFARFIPFFTPMCLLHTKKIFFHYQQQHNNNGNVLKSSIFVWIAGKNETELSCEQGDAMGGTMKNKYYHCESEAEIANLSWDIQAWCRDYNWMAGSYVISWCRFIKSSTLEMQIRPDTACVCVLRRRRRWKEPSVWLDNFVHARL